MKKKETFKKKNDFINKFIEFLKKHPNKNKKGELEDMLKDDNFHNKNMTEDQYQTEQRAWLEKIKKE